MADLVDHHVDGADQPLVRRPSAAAQPLRLAVGAQRQARLGVAARRRPCRARCDRPGAGADEDDLAAGRRQRDARARSRGRRTPPADRPARAGAERSEEQRRNAPSRNIRNMNTPNHLGPNPKPIPHDGTAPGRSASLRGANSCCHGPPRAASREEDVRAASIPRRFRRRRPAARRLRHRAARPRRAAALCRPAHLARDADQRAPRSCRPTPMRAARRPPPGEEKTVAYIAERFQQAGPSAGQQGQLVPGRAAGRDHRHAAAARDHRRRRRRSTFDYRTDFVANTYQVQPRVELERQRDGLRRLRHQRARARLERLCGRRRARQDGGHPGQRSRLAGTRTSRARSTAGR